MLKKLFRKFSKKEIEPVSLTSIKVDMHSHLIPNIDDGSQSLEESILMIKGLMRHGYTKSITTPHIMSEGYANTPEIILNGLKKVKNEIAKQEINFEIEAAAEYYIDDNFEKLLEETELLTFGNKYLLFEFSYMNKPLNYMGIIKKIIDKGYKPVLAHPERYSFFHNDFDVYKGLKNYGVYLQLNLFSLAGAYSQGPFAIGRQLLDNNLIDFLGTDIHNLGQLRYLENCRKDKYLKELIENGHILNESLLSNAI
jgi:tyrosine-protein phosphatase YwqE